MQKFRSDISNLYRTSDFGYYFLRIFFKVYEFGLKFIPDEVIIKRSFKKHMGYELDLDNPKTLNEKINWLKLYNRNDLQTKIADKYAVRFYIKEKIGEKYLIPLLYTTENAKDLKPSNFPDTSFIIKTNHDSSGGEVVIDKKTADWNRIRKRFNRGLKDNHYLLTREWQYKNIKPRIIVEKLLISENGGTPYDYKFHCFNGKIAFLGVDVGRNTDKRFRNMYDSNWNRIPCNWGRPSGGEIEKPTNFEEMKKLAEIIAKDFIYIRVDFYSVKGKTYFGELTLHHSSGLRKFWQPECDEKLGRLLNLKIKSNNFDY